MASSGDAAKRKRPRKTDGGEMKRCDICDRNEATMKVSHLDKDGNATELSVCAECAEKRGLAESATLKAGVEGMLAELKARVDAGDRKLVCPGCGMSFAEFKRSGRVGCDTCYTAFHDQLVPVLRRLHGAVQHVGKTTSSGRKLAQDRLNLQWLRGELKRAIDGEDYEKAAALRDRLNKAGHEAGD